MPASTEVAAVRRLLELGVARVVIGTETLADPAALERLRAELPEAPLVLSLDLRAGRVLSPDAELARLGAAEALARLVRSGVREVIVLDLARVGSGAGPDVALVRELCARFPELELLAGGGVRDARRPARPGRGRGGRSARRHRPARRRDRTDELRALGERGRQPTTVSRCSASAAATSTPVARSTPCQPGMPLTSST